MLNRIFKISTLFAFALVFVLTSCQKENLDELTTENFTQQAENREGGQKGPNGMNGKGKRGGKCFTPVFPITINFPDGSAVEVADKEAAKTAKEAYKTANPANEERPTLAMPFDVQLKDGATLTIASEEDLTALKETCGKNGKGGKGKRGGRGGKCFTPIFPITINFPDGTTVEVADKDAAKEAKSAYKEANPDSEERPTIAMPFDVQLKDSTIVTIASEEDLATLKETCGEGRGGRGQRCFQPVFPLTINFPDGTTATVADRDEAKAAGKAFQAANPDNEERPTLAFPYEVELADGTTITVETDEDVAALKESCEGERGERGGRGNGGQGGRPGGN